MCIRDRHSLCHHQKIPLYIRNRDFPNPDSQNHPLTEFQGLHFYKLIFRGSNKTILFRLSSPLQQRKYLLLPIVHEHTLFRTYYSLVFIVTLYYTSLPFAINKYCQSLSTSRFCVYSTIKHHIVSCIPYI